MHFGPVDGMKPYISGHRWKEETDYFSTDGNAINGQPSDGVSADSTPIDEPATAVTAHNV